MNGIEGGGVIRFEAETQYRAWRLFDLACEGIESAVASAVNEGYNFIEAEINARRVLMSITLGFAAEIPEMLRQGFEEKEEWWDFVDSQIAARDEAKAAWKGGDGK